MKDNDNLEKNSLIFFFYLLLLISMNNIAYAEEDICSLYYSNISRDECEELIILHNNYAFYDNVLKEIAKLRSIEIKEKMYNNDAKVNYKLQQINNLSQNKDIPKDIYATINTYIKDFNNLETKVKKELLMYTFNDYDNKYLSENASKYLANKEKMLLK